MAKSKKGDWTPAGGGQTYGKGPSNPAPVQNNAVGSSPAAVAAMIANTAPAPPKPQPSYEKPPPLDLPLPPSPPAPSGGGYTPPPPPPPPKPINPWITTSNFVAPTGIKQADPDIVLFNERPISPEYMVQLEYESIAGMELINISRSDLINGQKVVYSPIKNLSSIRRKYNPNNIINLSELSASFFSRFAIDLVQRGMNDPYFDDEGNLIIEIDSVRDDELIEVEIDTNATIEEVMFV